MPTLKVKIKGQDVEVNLTMGEFIQLLNEGKEPQPQIPIQMQAKTSIPHEEHKHSSHKRERRADEPQIDVQLQPIAEVKKYILSQPNFSFNLFDLQEHFFGKRFASGGETFSMYHKTYQQAATIRRQIEREHGGKFVVEVGVGGINQYVFQKKESPLAKMFNLPTS